MTLRCRKNMSAGVPNGGMERYMGRCLESPGLKEVVISFFPGASSTHHHVHLLKDKPIQEDRRKTHFLVWFLLGILCVAIWFILSSRKGHVFGISQENGGHSDSAPITFSNKRNTENVISTPNSDRSSTPEPEFLGATIAQHGELLMSELEKELRVTFSFDDDTETILESVDIF